MSTITITEQEYNELRQKLAEATVEYDLMLKILYHQLPKDGSIIEVPFKALEVTDIIVGTRVDRDRQVVEVKRIDETKESKPHTVTVDDPGPLFVQQLSLPFEEV